MATERPDKTTGSGAAQGVEQSLASIRNGIARRRANIQRIQNVLLVWLDNNTDKDSDDYQSTVTQLRRIMNDIHIFTDGNQCIKFIAETNDNKVCMIISGALGQHIVPCVHDMPQVDSIFIFCGKKKRNERWAKPWLKIKGVFTEIASICEALKQVSKQCEQDAMPISFVATNDGASNKNLNQLDPTFMYTEILKKILFTIHFEQKHFEEFIGHCRIQFAQNGTELENINKLERNYREETPIWWYTFECFLYPMLNLSLRTMDTDIIIKMGFFINDLHRHIQKLHFEQFGDHLAEKAFTVYRGQGLPVANFEQMKKTQGGLMSFNNFLSTSKKRDVSMQFAHNALIKPDSVGVLFVMTIDPAQSTTPFASVNDVGYFREDEDEVLFSMHSVFRIGDIRPMNENTRLFEVNLTLTRDNDGDLRQLTDRIEKETYPEEKGWSRLGSVLHKMGQYKQAEEIFSILLEQSDNEREKGFLYHKIGMTKDSQGQYQEAIEFYEKTVEIYMKILPHTDLSLAALYNDIGLVYKKMGNYSKALSYYEKDLEISQKTLPPNHPDLAISYNNIGNIHKNLGDYAKALLNYEKDLEISQKALPSNHPDLALSYNNIALVYEKMDDYRSAQLHGERAVAIGEQSLPPNHPHLLTCKRNLDRIKSKL